MGAHLHAHSADSSYQVRLESLPSLDELGVRWQELERRSRCSFFVSWRWIGPWLALIAPLRYARLLSVSQDERLVALGVITQRRRFLGLGPLHMRLHEVGDKVLDNLTIEYNGLVCEDGHEREALAAVLDHLAHNDKRWLTLYLPGMEADNVPFERIRSLDMGMRSRKHAAHYIDLTELRETGSDYLPTVLSSKARAAVRRTARKLQTGFGELSVAVAASAEEKTKALFNDKDLTGWIAVTKTGEPEAGDGKTTVAKGRFKVAEEVIVVDAKTKGDVVLTTKESFEGDVTIGFDYLPGAGSNNDIYFRGTKFDIKAKDIANLKPDAWNRLEIVAKGMNVEIRSNSEVIKTLKAKTATGTLGLRAEAGAIQFRKLSVTGGK